MRNERLLEERVYVLTSAMWRIQEADAAHEHSGGSEEAAGGG